MYVLCTHNLYYILLRFIYIIIYTYLLIEITHILENPVVLV